LKNQQFLLKHSSIFMLKQTRDCSIYRPCRLHILPLCPKGKAADAKSFHHGVNFIPPRRKFRSTMTEQNFLRVGTT